MTSSPPPEESDTSPACVMVFNANDPSGAGGLSADIATISSVGGHALSIMTGSYVRDTSQVFDHYSLDEEAVTEQARTALEDVPVQIFKVGFVGNPENLAVIAEISSDYPDIPLVAYMPNLSWWTDEAIESYLDAFEELLLPQASVLVGNHSTLSRWLLPDWSQQRPPSARDIAAAAAEKGVPYTLVTGMTLPDQHVDNVLASPETIMAHAPFELFDAIFTGAGDTLSAALAALLATGMDLSEATTEALSYLDRCLHDGFRPGMGHVIPDRFFWAEPDEDSQAAEDAEPHNDDPLAGFVMPPHDTQH